MVKNSNNELEILKKYFNLVNYLSVGQLYLKDNPLLREKLKISDIKEKIVGHWGTVPSQNFVYMHLNRVINKYDLNMMLVSGPGHGGNFFISNTYVEGSYSEVYPNITQDYDGLKKLFKQFSFPGGVSSHVSPEVPGSIHEGGELGYSLAHSFGAVLDNPDLIVTCIVGDGEAETGPLATSWNYNKFLNPKTDGCVLPILNLNGYKISNPTVLARISEDERINYFKGLGFKPFVVSGDNIDEMNKIMADTMDEIITEIKNIQKDARENNIKKRPIWPMIILITPKGWTCPKIVSGKQIENTFRAHQVPLTINSISDLKILEDWLKSYKPEELFNDDGSIKQELKDFCPKGIKRIGLNPNSNGGLLLEELKVPDFRNYKVKVEKPGETISQDMMELSKYIRDVIDLNKDKRNFRAFGPDEALSNRLNHIFEKTNRQVNFEINENDEYLNQDGMVIDSYLSEHATEGWLEGYLLTGRHGFLHTYEAFSRIIDSMVSQHAKWLKVCKELEFRKEISSLNILLTSHIWQQDHNGYTHQDPGFLTHLVTKKADIVRMYLPPDTNCLLSCFDHCIKTKNYINVIVASKHPSKQWLNMNDAIKHCTKGVGVWEFASNDKNNDVDLIMACSGDTPTLESLAATSILRKNFPDLKIRFINVVDLMRLQTNTTHPHGLNQNEYDNLFTKDKPIIFNFHGYPSLIHQLTYKRNNKNLHVHGYIEEGTITTPFDERVQNEIDRYHLVIDALKYLPQISGEKLIDWCENKLKEHKKFIYEYGYDLDEVRNWNWDL